MTPTARADCCSFPPPRRTGGSAAVSPRTRFSRSSLPRRGRRPRAKRSSFSRPTSRRSSPPAAPSTSASARGTRKVVFADLAWSVWAEGRLEVDDKLVASVTGLSFRGEGAMGMLLADKLGEKLKGVDGYRLPLAVVPVGGLRLRDLRLHVSDTDLELEASFGS